MKYVIGYQKKIKTTNYCQIDRPSRYHYLIKAQER